MARRVPTGRRFPAGRPSDALGPTARRDLSLGSILIGNVGNHDDLNYFLTVSQPNPDRAGAAKSLYPTGAAP
jgi:hypothetical protein